MSDFRVEKTAAPVRLLLADGGGIGGTLFLCAVSPSHAGPETVGELMANAARVLPFHNERGDFALIGKAAVAAVGVPGADSDLPWVHKVPLRVHLSGGHVLDGLYLAEEGIGQRLSDALNSDEAWFRLEQGETLFWVAKDHLLTVEPERA